MGDKNNLITYEPVNDFMVFKWGDGLESYIELKTLREKCPCALKICFKQSLANISKACTFSP